MKGDHVTLSIDDVKAMIKQAVEAGRQNGSQSAKQIRTPYQKTEARLYAYPSLKIKIDLDVEEVGNLKASGQMKERSKDLTRFSRGGSRVSLEEKLEAVIDSMESSIEADKHEVTVIDKVLTHIAGEYFYPTIPAKYFTKRGDTEMAEELNCSEKTITRQRSRLVKELSVLLYGSEGTE